MIDTRRMRAAAKRLHAELDRMVDAVLAKAEEPVRDPITNEVVVIPDHARAVFREMQEARRAEGHASIDEKLAVAILAGLAASGATH